MTPLQAQTGARMPSQLVGRATHSPAPQLTFAEVRLFDSTSNLLARASNSVPRELVMLSDVVDGKLACLFEKPIAERCCVFTRQRGIEAGGRKRSFFP